MQKRSASMRRGLPAAGRARSLLSRMALLPPPKKEVMFSVRSVCLSVCLSVCPSDYSQTCERILTQFFGGVGHGSRTKWYNFGGDPDHASDPGVQSPKSGSSGLPCSAEVCSLWVHLVDCFVLRLSGFCPGLPGWAGTRKGKPIWILLKQETVSGSGISWAICKSAPRPRQITTPVPNHSVFYRPDALKAIIFDSLKSFLRSICKFVLPNC